MAEEGIGCLVKKGREAVEEGRFQEAEDCLKEAIKRGSDSTCYTFLAECYLRQGKREEGLDALAAASSHPEKTRETFGDLSTYSLLRQIAISRMLGPEQKIIYRRNGKVISELASDLLGVLGLGHLQYLRHMQPFVSRGNELSIPMNDGTKTTPDLQTAEVQEDVTRKGNTLICQTRNITYEIEYVNIDLGKILEDGEDKGVNKPIDGVAPSPFPLLS